MFFYAFYAFAIVTLAVTLVFAIVTVTVTLATVTFSFPRPRDINGHVFALAVVPDRVIFDRIALNAGIQIWIIYDMCKDIIAVNIRCDEAEALVHK